MMDEEQIVDALNLWMDAFIADPERFRQQFAAIKQHMAERDDALIPSYGQVGLAFMQQLLAESPK